MGEYRGNHVTTACSRCRKRHIKCDSGSLSCRNCIDNGITCVRTAPMIKRGRKPGTKNGEGIYRKNNYSLGTIRNKESYVRKIKIITTRSSTSTTTVPGQLLITQKDA